jgi:dTDP-D-glucose 4,6-dehydratase
MKKILNWIPTTSLSEGIKKTVDWYINNSGENYEHRKDIA